MWDGAVTSHARAGLPIKLGAHHWGHTTADQAGGTPLPIKLGAHHSWGHTTAGPLPPHAGAPPVPPSDEALQHATSVAKQMLADLSGSRSLSRSELQQHLDTYTSAMAPIGAGVTQSGMWVFNDAAAVPAPVLEAAAAAGIKLITHLCAPGAVATSEWAEAMLAAAEALGAVLPSSLQQSSWAKILASGEACAAQSSPTGDPCARPAMLLC